MTGPDDDARISAPDDAAPPASLRRPRKPRAPAARAAEPEPADPAALAPQTAASVAPLVCMASDSPPAAGGAASAPSPAQGGQGARALRARDVLQGAGWTLGALLLVFLALRPAPFAPADAPLPAYAAALRGGAGTFGAAPDGEGEVRLGPGDRLELSVHPAARVRFPVGLRAYLVRGGEVRAWPAPAVLDDEGSARVAGTREGLFAGVPAGAWEIVVAIGRAEALPESPAALAAALRAPDEERGYRLARARGRLVLADAPR